MIVSFIEKIKDVFFRTSMRILSLFYEKLFHEGIDEEVENFIKNLSYVGFGIILSTIFVFLFNFVAGRLLGPIGYGNFTLVQSIAMFLYIPMILGFNTAMMKYCAEYRDSDSQNKIISTTYSIVILLIIISLMIYFIFSNQLMILFSVDYEILCLSIIFAIFYVLYTLTTSTLIGLHHLKGYSLFQSIYGFLLFLTFLVFICIHFTSYKAMIYANYLAYGIIGCAIAILILKKHITLRISPPWLSSLWKFSNLAIICTISFNIYTNIDCILINYYMDVQSVGIYGVYYMASFPTVMIFTSVFTTVLFPTASKLQDKKSLYMKLKKITPYLFVLGIPGVLIGEFLILKLFGPAYPIDVPLMIIFAVAAVLTSLYQIFGCFFTSNSLKGIKLISTSSLIIALMNIILNIILIPIIGLDGAIGATAISFAIGLFLLCRNPNLKTDCTDYR